MSVEFLYFKTITVIRKLRADTDPFYGHEADLRQDTVVSACSGIHGQRTNREGSTCHTYGVFKEPAVSSHMVCRLPLKALFRSLKEVPAIKKNTNRRVEEIVVFDIYLTLLRKT